MSGKVKAICDLASWPGVFLAPELLSFFDISELRLTNVLVHVHVCAESHALWTSPRKEYCIAWLSRLSQPQVNSPSHTHTHTHTKPWRRDGHGNRIFRPCFPHQLLTWWTDGRTNGGRSPATYRYDFRRAFRVQTTLRKKMDMCYILDIR